MEYTCQLCKKTMGIFHVQMFYCPTCSAHHYVCHECVIGKIRMAMAEQHEKETTS